MKTKTNKQNQNKTQKTPETQNRTEQLSENTAAETPASESPLVSGPVVSGPSVKPFVNFAERDFNRKLPVEKVLEKLRRWMPKQYELAEVVGQWIWITFPEQPAETVRADLSQLGFHWNNTRKCWQHPCGETLPRGQQEPRDKYEVWFPRTMATRRRKQKEAQDAAAAALGAALGKRALAQAAEDAAYDAANPYRYNGPARTAEQVAA